VYTVKEMAEHFGISFELLAKVMSALAKAGIVRSSQGVNGGFAMARPSTEVSVRDVLTAVHGPQQHLVECGSHPDQSCSIEDACTIRHPLMRLQAVIDRAMSSMAIADLHGSQPSFVDVTMEIQE
ncbi:MAG: RrF2 family transcriptional regulator, partial [Candidatus Kapaibacterium sp.]